MDYRKLPRNGVYGTYQAYVYAVHRGKKIGCATILVNFDPENGVHSDECDDLE